MVGGLPFAPVEGWTIPELSAAASYAAAYEPSGNPHPPRPIAHIPVPATGVYADMADAGFSVTSTRLELSQTCEHAAIAP